MVYLSRTLFFLFCAGVVFPIDQADYVFPKGVSDNSWVNWTAGAFLTVCAISQLIKICFNKGQDEPDEMTQEPMMENTQPYP